MRFNYIRYDDQSQKLHEDLKLRFEDIEALVEQEIPPGREKALILTKLEEAFMWVGKAVKNAQVVRVKSQQPHVPERG